METDWTDDGLTAVLAPASVRTADEVAELRDALLAGFADVDAVLCDLAGAAGAAGSDAAGGSQGRDEDLARALAGVAGRVSPWPAAVLAVAAPPDGVRAALPEGPAAPSLVVADDRAQARAAIGGRPGSRAARRVLEPLLRAPSLGRAFLRDTLAAWGDESRVDDALLVVDELVANAVVHTGTEVELRLALLDGRLGVAVADRAEGRPEGGDPGASAEGGRGLLLVDALAGGWHVLPRRDGGKVVRAVLAGGPDPATVAGRRPASVRGAPS